MPPIWDTNERTDGKKEWTDGRIDAKEPGNFIYYRFFVLFLISFYCREFKRYAHINCYTCERCTVMDAKTRHFGEVEKTNMMKEGVIQTADPQSEMLK